MITKYGFNNYDKDPKIIINNKNADVVKNYQQIVQKLKTEIQQIKNQKKVIVIDYYYGVDQKELMNNLILPLKADHYFNASDFKKSNNEINKMIAHWNTNDRIFGKLTTLNIDDFFLDDAIQQLNQKINEIDHGLIIIYNTGAGYLTNYHSDIIIYADMCRWEIELRQRNGQDNWDVKNYHEDIKRKYKRSYFIEWRVFDKHKRRLFNHINYWLDTNRKNDPTLVNQTLMIKLLEQTVNQPFRLKPYFDPGVWGGQWMKEVMDLDRDAKNFAWSFDCVPEENSLTYLINDIRFEMPAINLVFFESINLLGEKVFCHFGAEFPIRSDLLDNMGGQNLSLHVHPLVDYMKQEFNMSYTQDESYYILASESESAVYLGFKENVDRTKLKLALENAVLTNQFSAGKFINKFIAKKHDHFMIPAGTPHCSAKNTMVLEISATPYIFTLRMWDWNRVDFDGKPRAIHIDHAMNNLQLQFDTTYCQKHLMNQAKILKKTNDYTIERTGLNEREFIETYRYHVKKKVIVETNNVFHLLNVVEGSGIKISSLTNEFKPFIAHYAEAVVIPANIKSYQVQPVVKSEKIIFLTSFVRI